MLQYALMTESIEYREEDLFSLGQKVVDARFGSHARSALDDYIAAGGNSSEGKVLLRDKMLHSVQHPLPYPPELTSSDVCSDIVSNNASVREVMEERATSLTVFSSEDGMRELIAGQHDLWKIAQNRWFLANPRLMLEIETGSAAIPPVSRWLQEECDVAPTDEIVLPHIVGKDTVPKLMELGFNIPSPYLDLRDMKDGMKKASKLVLSNQHNKGILLVSWIADPTIFEDASDGRPFVGFAPFPITGTSKDFGEARPDNELSTYYHFATENPRRKKMAERKKFKPRVFGIFLSRDEIAAAA